jgi:hypothetical protein
LEILSGEVMKYNIGDIIVETCFKYIEDWRTGYVTNLSMHILPPHKQVVTIYWFDIEKEECYNEDEIDRWFTRSNAKHYSVNKHEEKEIQTKM